MIGFRQFKTADAPFIRTKRLRELICQLGTSKDIKFREEDERAVLWIARHSFHSFRFSFLLLLHRENPRVGSAPATNVQSGIDVATFTFPRRTRPSEHSESMRASGVSEDRNSVYRLRGFVVGNRLNRAIMHPDS